MVHYIAMNVMLVCSVSTVLFNANPLLRYDGYYVLSDLTDVPNLSQVSNKVLTGCLGRLLFGLPNDDQQPTSRGEKFWLIVYASAAFLYRWALTLVIFWFLLLMLRPYRLESIGWVLCLLAVGGLLYSTLRSPITFIRNPIRRRQIQMGRLLKSSFAFLLVLLFALYPLPSGEFADGRLVPRAETPIYAATDGHLESVSMTVGQTVSKGDVIAVLSDPEITLRYEEAKTRFEKQLETVAALRANRLITPESSNELPQAEVMLKELERQLETRRSRLEAQTIRAPAAGRLIDGPQKGRTPEDDVQLVRWNGNPVDSANRGCYLESGTELFSLITDKHWDAELRMTATQARRIEVGSPAKLVCASMPSKVLRGIVTDVSVREWNAEENRERRDASESVGRTTPVQVSYAVRVELSLEDVEAPELLTGAQVAGRVVAERISIVARALRMLHGLVRFR